MPSASTKPENKASMEAGDPMKQVLMVMDKKVRNLEKRKGKLDAYKEKEESGVILEKDQKAAVDKYGEVLQNLEFARELQKQFQNFSNEADKFLKKQAKREKVERQNAEAKRIKEVLQLQNLLDSLGSDKVRSDFQTGKHGAVVLTEDNLQQLDELYKLLSPTREGETKYQDQLTTASEHLVSLLEAKDKSVVGTTYKELKEMIDMIGDCGYFENAPGKEEGADNAGEQEYVVVHQSEVPQPDSSEVQASLPPEISEQQHLEPTNTALHPVQQPDLATMAEADSFFSKAPTEQQALDVDQSEDPNQAFTRQRPFQEIVSEVQGNFNFLQESTIDMESPIMDPAVVAAHPMPTSALGSSNIPSQTFTNSGFGDLQGSRDNSQTKSNDASLLSQQSVSSLVGQDFNSSDYNPQSFSQTSLTQGLQSDSLFHQSAGIDNSSATVLGQNMISQNLSDATISQYEMPPQIPMPPRHDQPNQNDDAAAEKKFQMNPNAQMFQSQLYSSSVGVSQSEEGNNFNSNYRGSRGGNFRGRGGRGGDRGGMSNGYRGNNRGGNEFRGRGGNNYQNYQSRQNYRQDGYQGYNGNSSGNNGYQKRDGGFSRGGNRGNSGSMRGGAPRGSSRGNRGGFGNRNQQQ